MCELLGLCLNRPVSASITIRQFGDRDAQNADGWGLAWYPDRSIALIKEPVSWSSSGHTDFLESYRGITSSIYMAHVRHKTVGGVATHADTHPFVRELGGREYCFAHNGTLEMTTDKLPLGRFRPIGGTDSEHLFAHLMSALADRGATLEEPAQWELLHELLVAANRFGKLNCLLSDGRTLFCYRDRGGHKGLGRRAIEIGHAAPNKLRDAELTVHFEKDSSAQGFVVATHPLDAEDWDPIPTGELIAFQQGRQVYPAQFAPSEKVAEAAGAT